MANYFEKITVLIDVTTDKAVAGLKSFRTEVANAEGFTGKFKAGAGSLKSSLGGLVAGLGPSGVAGAAAAAGAAMWAAGEKFVDAARQTRDLAIATGLSNEEASRLIDVFGDLGGDASSLAGSIGKITKDLDAEKWKKYGVETREASGEVKSANEIFLDALNTIRNIKDPTERAAAGTELFGKSWGNLAPLISKSNSELEDMLENVSDAKVLTDEEVKSAEDLAEAQDAIKDVVEDLTLEVGKMVAELAPLLPIWEASMKPLEYGLKAIGWMAEQSGKQLQLWADAGKWMWNSLFGPSEAEKRLEEYKKIAEDVPPVLVAVGDAAKEAAEQEFYAAQKAAELERALANRKGGVAFAAAQAEESISEMMDAISDDRQWISVQLEMDDLQERLEDIAQQYKDNEITEREAQLRTRDEILKTKESLTGYLDELDNMDPYLKQRILFEFDQGDIDSVLKLMQGYMDGKKLQVQIGATSIPGMPWVGGTGPKDEPYTPANTNLTINIGVAGNPPDTARYIVQLLNDYGIATGGVGNAGRI